MPRRLHEPDHLPDLARAVVHRVEHRRRRPYGQGHEPPGLREPQPDVRQRERPQHRGGVGRHQRHHAGGHAGKRLFVFVGVLPPYARPGLARRRLHADFSQRLQHGKECVQRLRAGAMAELRGRAGRPGGQRQHRCRQRLHQRYLLPGGRADAPHGCGAHHRRRPGADGADDAGAGHRQLVPAVRQRRRRHHYADGAVDGERQPDAADADGGHAPAHRVG